MHPEISQLLSHVRYGGKLFNGFKKEEELEKFKGKFKEPISMLTHNYSEAIPDGCHNFGYYNIYEAMIIKLEIEQFSPEELRSVGIITFYRAQADLLKKLLE